MSTLELARTALLVVAAGGLAHAVIASRGVAVPLRMVIGAAAGALIVYGVLAAFG